MNRILKITLSAMAAAVTIFAPAAKAETLVKWDMLNNLGNETTEPPALTATGVTGGTITRGGGLAGNTGGGSLNSTSWGAQTGAGVKSSGYLSFTLNLGA